MTRVIINQNISEISTKCLEEISRSLIDESFNFSRMRSIFVPRHKSMEQWPLVFPWAMDRSLHRAIFYYQRRFRFGFESLVSEEFGHEKGSMAAEKTHSSQVDAGADLIIIVILCYRHTTEVCKWLLENWDQMPHCACNHAYKQLQVFPMHGWILQN